MQVVSAELVKGKKVLLRLDIDVPLREISDRGKVIRSVTDDFRLRAGLPTLKLCLENASEVVILGHIGRPAGLDPNFSVEPIYDWFFENGFSEELKSGKLKLLENLRFEKGESSDTAQDKEVVLSYAKELANFGDFFVNESFAAYHPAASTTVLPTLLPHAAGLRFASEVEKLTKLRENPEKPFVAIIGGAKIEDKLPVAEELAKRADKVLLAGKLPLEIKERGVTLPENVLIARLNEEGTDVMAETVEEWKKLISKAKTIVWNGPLGQIELPRNFQTHEFANAVIQTQAETIIGGGDTVGYLDRLGLLERFSFVSTGGGAMLEFLQTGTLPTIEVLQ